MYYGFAESVIIAGPRNAHRRPLIPPLAILFSSLFARSVCAPRCRGITFPGAQLPSRAALSCPFYFSLSPALLRVTSMRPFCNHYRLSQLDHRCAADLLPFSFHSFDRSFPSFALVYLRISHPNSLALHYGLGGCNEVRANFSINALPALARKNLRGNLLSKCAANIRSRAHRPAHLYVRWIFDGLLEASILLAISILSPQLLLAN